jgi:adenosylcobinamide-GDP ribazoletransferase
MPQDWLEDWLADLAAAARFLTRLPVPLQETPGEGPSLATACRAFPLVGVVIGGLGGAAYALAFWLGLGAWPSAFLAVLASVLVTGALHEDGLADTADGLGGGRDAEHALAIMRDSRSGAYGVLALVFSVGLRAGAVAALGAPAAVIGTLVAAHAGSRGALPFFMRRLDPARADGLGATAGRPQSEAALWAAGIGIAVLLLAFGFGRAVLALIVVAGALALLAGVARRKIGGYTGDVLGAAQQLAETIILLIAASS